MFKWILAVLAFVYFGKIFPFALLGYVIGTFIDQYQNVMRKAKAEGRGFSSQDLFDYYQQHSSQNDVPTILMALSAAVMKADGKVVRSELDYVKMFLRQQFGENYSTTHLQTLKHFLDGEVPLEKICQDVRLRMQPEVRVQLLHYMFGIAKADGVVSDTELGVLSRIASMMGVASVDYESVKNMFYRDVDSDYKILGIEPSATDEEVKKAYRQMAIKFHPDKVASMGEEYEKGAKEKFQQIQEAYEAIKKTRGL